MDHTFEENEQTSAIINDGRVICDIVNQTLPDAAQKHSIEQHSFPLNRFAGIDSFLLSSAQALCRISPAPITFDGMASAPNLKKCNFTLKKIDTSSRKRHLGKFLVAKIVKELSGSRLFCLTVIFCSYLAIARQDRALASGLQSVRSLSAFG